MEGMPRQRTTGTLIAVGLLGLAFFTLALYAHRDFYHDDAFIPLRYARHFLQGEGLVWNPAERVQGYSSFLHVVLVSLLGRLGVDLVQATRLIGIAALAGLAAFNACYAVRRQREEPEPPFLVGCLWLLATCSIPLMAWSLGGLETCLYTLLVTIAVWLFTRQLAERRAAAPWLGCIFALAAVCRPDALLLFAVTAGFCLWRDVIRRPPRGRYLLALLLGFLVVYAPFFIGCWFYYGAPLPNTFHVKASGFSAAQLQSGFRYLWAFALTPPYLPALVVIAGAIALLRRVWTPPLTYLSILLASYVAYVVYVGGDHMPAFRFFAPLVPAAALFVYLAVSRACGQTGTPYRFAALVLTVVLVALQLVAPGPGLSAARQLDPAAYFGSIVGTWINQTWPAGSLVALHTAGSTPYYARQLRFIDMLGLNDRHIARRRLGPARTRWQKVPGHAKGDGRYVLERSPDYIILGPAYGTTSNRPWFLSDIELNNSPEFHRRYRLRVVRIPVSTLPGFEHDTRIQALPLTYYERHTPLPP